jgi:glucose/arabinose dehydrogenase
MSFDPLTGNLWDTENGPSYGDEINLVEPGFNSGWSKVMGFSGKLKNFDPNQLVNFDGNGIYSEPEFEWKETVAPTSIIFIPDDKLSKKYEGDMLVGSVNYGGRIFNFDLTSDRKELLLSGPLEDKIAHSFEELDKNLFATNAGIVTDMEIGPDGYLYILTHYSSKVLIIKIF